MNLDRCSDDLLGKRVRIHSLSLFRSFALCEDITAAKERAREYEFATKTDEADYTHTII